MLCPYASTLCTWESLSSKKVQIKTLTLSKLGQLALKIISLRVIRELIIVIKYVTEGVIFAVNAWDFGCTILLSEMSSISGPKSRKAGLVGPFSWYLWMDL